MMRSWRNRRRIQVEQLMQLRPEQADALGRTLARMVLEAAVREGTAIVDPRHVDLVEHGITITIRRTHDDDRGDIEVDMHGHHQGSGS